MSVAEKVRKLAALAASDNEHEANAAARQACRLIREGKVRLSDEAPERPASAPRARRPAPGWTPWDAWGAPPPPPPPPAARKPVPRGPFVRSRSVVGQACFVCNETIDEGDAFSCQGGFVHGDCVPANERR